MPAADVEPKSMRKVTPKEIVVLVVVIVAAMSLLLPALPKSRDAARANLCHRNLRGLYQLTVDYIKSQRVLPSAATWPGDLLPRTRYPAFYRRDNDVFSMPRPSFLTCPARTDPAYAKPVAEQAHYQRIVDRDPSRRSPVTSWQYRDLPTGLPPDRGRAWYVGQEVTSDEAARQLTNSRGPHPEGTFLGIDAQGAARVYHPNPSPHGGLPETRGR